MRKSIILLFIVASSMLQAITIKGKVNNSEGQPFPFVTISLLSPDSALITGTITQDDGSFKLETSQKASILRVSYIGYQTEEIKLTTEYSNIQIILHEQTEQIEEVIIQPNPKLIERRTDKIVLNVATSPFSIGNNSKDILKKAPGVHIDRKGKITVNGKEVQVYIDNRPTHLTGNQLRTLLEGTDGSTIDRIEIITQPSAKYDAAGEGGIINIRTKRNRSNGMNGIISASYGGMYWQNIKQYMQEDHLSFNLNYRGTYTYTAASISQQFNDPAEQFKSTITSPNEERLSHYHLRTKNQYYMLKIVQDWYIDSSNILGAIVSTPISRTIKHSSPEHNYSQLIRNGKVIESNTEEQGNLAYWMQHAAGVYYTHHFSHTKNQEMTISFDYNRHNDHTSMHNKSQNQGDILTPYLLDITIHNKHTTNIYSGHIDFETLFYQTGKIESGAKWFTTQTDFHASHDTTISAPYTITKEGRSTFRYTEHVAALYLNISKQWGVHWNTKIGLRSEYTYAIGQWLMRDNSSKVSYFSLFPSMFVNYRPTEDWSISLNYIRRIQRPHYNLLDPSLQIEDAHSIRKGNPHLKPSFTNNLLLEFAYSEYVSLDYQFGYTHNWIDYETIILPGGDRLAQAINYGNHLSHGIHLSFTELPIVPKLGDRNKQGRREVKGAWLALTAQIGANHDTYRAYNSTDNMPYWTISIYAELNAYLPHDWMFSIDGFYCTPSVWGMERLSSWKEINIAIKKDFPKQGLTLTARVNDLMLSSQWCSETIGLPNNYTNLFIGNDYAHRFTFGLTYKFGTTFEYHSRSKASQPSPALPSSSTLRKRYR